MADPVIFENSIDSAAGRILQEIPPGGELTSWEIKTRLRLSNSVLFLALGWLAAREKIKLIPDQLNYRVKLPPQG